MKQQPFIPGWVVFILGLFFLASCVTTCAAHTERSTVTIQVTEKELVTNNDLSKYLIFTENETFEITDSLLEIRFDSSDLYGYLRLGECYEVLVYGWRVTFFSEYRNILEATRVECETDE